MRTMGGRTNRGLGVPDLSLNSICDGAVLNFDLTVHLQHLHISDGGGFSCN